MRKGKVIVVEGLIGAGKTCFSNELGKALGNQTLIFGEPDDENQANPYLGDYYKDQLRWAFTMQIHLLQARLKIHLDAQWYSLNRRKNAVIDRPFYGDTAFARLQYKKKYLESREYETYRSLYHSMTAQVLHPQICIWVQTTPETSARRINSRMVGREGRECESVIDLDYLDLLNKEIEHMISVLENAGVRVIRLDWNKDTTPETRAPLIESICETIKNYEPPDLFLDLHRRTI